MQCRIIILSLALAICSANDLIAQLNVTATARAATCAANGRISVNVSGGSGSYTYQLTGPCAENIPPQQDPVFDFLSPCQYTVLVVDRQTNLNGQAEVEVAGNYREMTLSVESEGCNQRLVVTGGRPPYRYSFSPEGVEGPYQPNTPDTSALFTSLSGSDIHLSVEDACGIRRAIPTASQLNPVRGVRFPATNEEGITVEVVGGTGPYTFRLFSPTDTFPLNRAFIPWDSMRCEAQIEVRDGCSALVRPVEYELGAQTVCVNFSAGTAEATALQGVAPYVFQVSTEQGVFTSETGVFDTLPINSAFYAFSIMDGCGKERQFDRQTRLKPEIADTDLGCADDVLRFNIVRECEGVLFPPVVVTCLNCSPQDTVQVSSPDQQFEWSGFPAGAWDILLVNECGDQTRCKDELIVELTPGCDSIVARIVDLFSCDNGTISRRVITGDDVTFFLRDENGALLVGDNKSGRFDNLPQGSYEVIAVLPDCDTLRNTATLAAPQPIDPYLETRVDYSDEGGSCRLYYDINIEKALGPFVLSGGPGDEYYQVLNNFKEDNCQFYSVRLRPGVYTLTSMSLCGSRILELPDPEHDLALSLVDNCPEDAKILADGARAKEEWEAYFGPFNLNVLNLAADYYQIDAGPASRKEDGFTFRGQGAGPHVVYLYALDDKTCPVDTLPIDIPEYDPVTIGLRGDVVCDNDSASDMEIEIGGGQGPYELRKLDCANGETLASFSVAVGETFVDAGLPLGGYCYAVSDVCQISADFQAKVRLFADSIRYGYTCDGMLHLAVDSLPVSYQWRNGRGEMLGDQFILSIEAPEQDETFTVQVGLPECVVVRSVTIPGREVIPTVEILHQGVAPVICGTAPQQLTAITNQNNEVLWNTGQTTGLITAGEPGAYVVVSSNDLGCTDSDTLELARIVPPEPQILGVPGYCFGESTELSLDQPYMDRLWSTGASTEQITAAVSGPVTVTVSDEYGCTGRDSVFVVEWPAPTPQIRADSLICPNATTLLALERDYARYEWSDGSGGATVTLGEGDHAVTVTDENGCREQDRIAIREKPQLYAQLSGDTTICAGDSALLSLSLTQPWYETELRIRGSAGEDVRLRTFGDTTFWLPLNNTTTLSLAEVKMEEYGCPVVARGAPVVNANRVNLVLQATPITCPGGSDGALQLFVASNFPPYDVNWSNGRTSNEISALAQGSYSVLVVDQLGCMASDSFALTAPAPIAPDWVLSSPLCRDINDGLIALDAVLGGTPPYRWRLNGLEQGQAPGEAAGLSAGTYQISLVDQKNCPWDTTVIFPQPPPFSLDLGEDVRIVIGETARLEPTLNVSGLVSWEWTAAPSMDLDSSLLLEVQPFAKTDFTLTVRNAYGCELTDRLSVFVDKDSQFDAPNAFSPDGDGRNDRFVLYGKPSNVEFIEYFAIYDRWGVMVFETNAMELNNEETGWDGQLNGQLLNAGVYVWMARVRRIDGETITAYGDVALVR